MKYFFYSYPLFSHNLALKNFILRLAKAGNEIIYYNTVSYKNFFNDPKIEFRSYKKFSNNGLGSSIIDGNNTIIKLGISIIASTECVIDSLESDIKRERPDLIIHPKFALWAKILAGKHKVPALSITSGFVFYPKFIINYVNNLKRDKVDVRNLVAGKELHSGLKKLQDKYPTLPIGIEDIFVNKENLNIVLNLKEFQPEYQELEKDFHFLGMNFSPRREEIKKSLIYISLGTAIIEEKEFFDLLVTAFSRLRRPTVIYVDPGNAAKIKPGLPKNIEIAELGSQLKYLKESLLFITHGGACSILESIYYEVPMIILPQIVEHKINSENVSRLGLGIQLEKKTLTSTFLVNTVNQMLKEESYFKNLRKFNQHNDLSGNDIRFEKLVKQYIEH